MNIHPRGIARGITITLLLAAVIVFTRSVQERRRADLEARTLGKKPPTEMGWKIIEAEEIEKGTYVPAGTHVILRLPLVVGPLPTEEGGDEEGSESDDPFEELPASPEEGSSSSAGGAVSGPGDGALPAPGSLSSVGGETVIEAAASSAAASSAKTLPVTTIAREALFGNLGKSIRYWGYCFPDRPDGKSVPSERRIGFPGDLFLSEAERAYRAKNTRKPVPISALNPPRTRDDLDRPRGDVTIRHQVEVFAGGKECYVVTNKKIPIGVDLDGDGLNSKLETDRRTDPAKVDTDEDGLTDGDEVFRYLTDPLKRDSDGDGIVDGLEARTGTDPRKADTDGDTLCDGICFVGGGRTCMDFPVRTTDCKAKPTSGIGEDKNLNGVVDGGETDPRKWATEDGQGDKQRYYLCLLGGGSDC